MSFLLYHKHSCKINYQTDTGAVTIMNKDQRDILNDLIENINFNFILGIILIDNVEHLGLVLESELVGIYENTDLYKILKVEFLPMDKIDNDDTSFCLKHLIHTNDFYIAKNNFTDDEFIWNLHMIQNFMNCKAENGKIILKHSPDNKKQNFNIGFLICGFFTTKTFRIDNDFFSMKLLSLVSGNKMGTRLLSRGIDLEGNVSFFVKTFFETKRNNKKFFNMSILRGSIPLFWKQKNKGINGKLYFTGNRREMEASFDKHFNKLNNKYGKIHVITLLGEKKDEKILSDAYTDLLQNKNIKFTSFDLNSHISEFDNLKNLFFWHLEKIDRDDLVYRVNCIDCLDRTNLAQFLICKYKLDKILRNSTLDKVLQECWTENGNALSNLYTGSDVMKKELSLKQKRSFMGMFDDFVISATRLINNRFTDKQKNKTINLLLGKNLVDM
ncbi:phosphoinositide phosphatase [Vairimorpha necatrix]|uniref:Phosphoinositide phosphatase n=1 Tax=Vairimorpha necatrix TaxID=6039 RepID=A0AAX4JDK9_9MICR